MEIIYFNEDTIQDFINLSKMQGWGRTLEDAWTFVTNDCDWSDEDDRQHVFGSLIHHIRKAI